MKATRIIAGLLCCCLLAACQTAVPEPSPASSQPETTAAAVGTASSTEPSTIATEPTPPEQLLLESMTLEEKVGQIFLARCPDTGAETDAAAYHLGGYILFGRDVKNQTPDSLSAQIAQYQSAAAIPMLIAVDEEGGTVVRVSSNEAFRDSRFLSPRDLYDQGGMELVLSTEEEKAELLSSVGFNVNMAPVCDITTNKSAFMYKRSLGQSPEVTAQFVSGAVEVMDRYHVGSVLKHFPGYRNNDDTHVGIAVDKRTLEELKASDLVPFAAGIQAGCGAILVSHTIIECLDGEYPATLSPAVISFLRNDMGYDGVIVTDDLVMEAITDRYGDGEAAVLAVIAGCDLLCATNYQDQYTAVLEAVESGRIPMDRLDSAVTRILSWKLQLELIDPSTLSN